MRFLGILLLFSSQAFALRFTARLEYVILTPYQKFVADRLNNPVQNLYFHSLCRLRHGRAWRYSSSVQSQRNGSIQHDLICYHRDDQVTLRPDIPEDREARRRLSEVAMSKSRVRVKDLKLGRNNSLTRQNNKAARSVKKALNSAAAKR